MEKFTLISRTIKYQKSSQCICSSVILIDYFFSTDKNCYPKVVLEKFKYVVKEKKIPKNIIDDV